MIERSPKDCEPFSTDAIKQKYLEELKVLLKDKKYPNNGNTKLIAIAKTATLLLKINSAQDVMAELLTSERVYTDLHDWLNYGEPEQIVFRSFIDEITLDYEFRAFVYNDKITCITQYDHYTYYEYLKEIKNDVKIAIYKKWKEIHELLKLNEYVIDFAWLQSKRDVIVIELSPYRRCTGTATFNWSTDEELLKYGNKCDNELDNIVFRLRDNIYPQCSDLVEANWELRWFDESNDNKPYWEWYTYARKDENNRNYWNIIMISVVGVSILGYIDPLYGIMACIVVLCFVVRWYINNRNKWYYLFVYGTLKDGFHWNHKFLSRGGTIITKNVKTVDKWPLILGDCNVPYMLDIKGKGNNIKGELYKIDHECMENLDEYEGVTKGHYKRMEISVQINNGNVIKAHVYCKHKFNDNELNREYIDEYTMECHKKYYSPIKHIQVKQLAYLGENNTLN